MVLAAVVLLVFRGQGDVRPNAGKKITIGCSECPPFQDRAAASSPMSGFALEVLERAAARLQLSVEFKPVSDSGKKSLLDGSVDVWPRLAPDRRTEGIYFSEPWINMNFCLLRKRGGAKVAKVAHVNDPFLRNLVDRAAPGAQSVPAGTSDLLARVCSGEVDAALAESRTVYALLLGGWGGPCDGIALESQPIPGPSTFSSVAGRPEAAWAVRLLRKEIGRMAEDGSLSEIHARWFFTPASDTGMLSLIQSARQDLFYLRGLAGVFALFVLILAYQGRRLGVARESAERAAQLKTKFVASVSHELRTPLSGVIGVTEMLGDTALTAQQSELVRLARSTTQTMLQVLSDLLDVAHADAGTLKIVNAPFELRPAVEEVVLMVAGRAAEKGIQLDASFEPGLPRRMSGDAARVRQILLNLLTNAVKFTDQGGVKLHVGMEHATPFQWTVSFAVGDTGEPIPKQDLPRLFEDPANQDAGREAPRRGAGLGLAVTRRVVELMGGQITVESDPALGTSFRCTLPFEVTSANEHAVGEQPSTSTPAAQTARPLRVLLCEDDPVSRKVAVHLLGKLAHHVDTVSRGNDAVDLAARQRFDLVLMDCQLPDIDGVEAARRIRAEGASAGVPVVALTAATLPEDRRRYEECGMDGCLAKPLSLAALAEAIARHGTGPGPAAAEETQAARRDVY